MSECYAQAHGQCAGSPHEEGAEKPRRQLLLDGRRRGTEMVSRYVCIHHIERNNPVNQDGSGCMWCDDGMPQGISPMRVSEVPRRMCEDSSRDT